MENIIFDSGYLENVSQISGLEYETHELLSLLSSQNALESQKNHRGEVIYKDELEESIAIILTRLEEITMNYELDMMNIENSKKNSLKQKIKRM